MLIHPFYPQLSTYHCSLFQNSKAFFTKQKIIYRIYFSLKKKLDSIGKKISFKTFYDQASALIVQWKQNEESLKKLQRACENAKVSIDELEKKLDQLEKGAEELFQIVFSEQPSEKSAVFFYRRKSAKLIHKIVHTTADFV